MPTMPTPSSAADGRSRVRLQLAAGCVLACVLGSTLLLHESEALRKHRAGKALRLSGGSTPARSSAAGGAVRLGGGGSGGGGGGTPARASAATGSVAMEAVVVAAPGSGSGTQVKKRHQGTGWEYWEFRPAGHEGAQADRKWPLIVFLHGAGESGHNLDDMISIGASGCPPVELANGSANAVLRENFVVASPQTARGWGDAAAIAEFTRGLVGSAELAIDPARVYCTGVSMGGAGAWVAGTTELFAAIAPVCGAGSVPPDALRGIPVWAFHGANDIVVPVRVTDKMVEALKAARSSEAVAAGGGPAEVKYTRYEASPAPRGWEDYTGHASWIPAFAGPELWTWLLGHSKAAVTSG